MTRSAVARPLDGSAVLVTMRRGSRGPWSVIVDAPAAGVEPLGPAPGFLALVGIASCTIVTVAGVASRGESPLRGMEVSFDVAPTAGDRGVAIRQRTTLVADLTERDRLRLTRAVGHCPVGRDFTKRAVDIEDDVLIGGVIAAGARPAPETSVEVPRAFVPGRVEADYLPETGEWRTVDGRAVLDQEGEVKAHVQSEADGAPRHWAFLGGHSSAGWAPRPSSYALGALAASTLMTVRAAAVGLAIDPTSLDVEVEVISPIPAGGKEASQELAATGSTARVGWRRTIRVSGVAPGADAEAIAAVARLDPVFGYLERGDLLAGEEIVVVLPSDGVPA